MALNANLLKKEGKRWTFIVILAFGGFLLFAVLLGILGPKPQNIKALAALPNNCALMLESNDVKKLQATLFAQPYANDLLKMPFMAKMTDDLRQLDSLLLGLGKEEFEILGGLVPSNAGDFDFIYVIQQQNTRLAKLMEKCEGAKLQTTVFKGQKIREITFKSGKTISACEYGNLWIFGRHSFLVELAVAQFHDGNSSLMADKFLLNNIKSACKGDVSLHFNLQKGIDHWKSFLNEKQQASLQNPSSNWLSIDLKFDKFGIAISGFAQPTGQPVSQALSDSKQPENPQISKVIPDDAATLWAYGARDFQGFYHKLDEGNSSIFAEYLAPWIGEEWAFFTKGNAQNQAVFKIGDPLLYDELVSNYINENELKPQSRGSNPIYEFTKPLNFPLFDLDSLAFEKAYFTKYEGYFLVANALPVLLDWLRKMEVGEALYGKPNFLQFTSKLATAYNVFYYTENAPKEAGAWGDFPAKLSPLGWRMQGYNGQFFTSGYLMVGEGKAQESTIWKLQLEQQIISAPKIVDLLGGQKGIFVQDDSLQLYLIGEDGHLLWKKQLGSKVLSDFHRLDVYNNKDVQFLFNTKNKLHLINTDGEPVKGKGYPKNTHPATAPLLVIDPDDRKDYRIFIPCEDGRIYGFQEDGKPLPGWSYKDGVGQILAPIRHLRFQGRDRFWGLNTTGQLFMWDEQGKEIHPPAALESTFAESLTVDAAPDLPRVIAIDSKGIAYIANLDNEFFKIRVNTGGKSSQSFAADILGNLEKDYAVLEGRNLLLNKHNKRAWRHRFDEYQDLLFPVKRLGSPKHYVGTYASFSRRLYCLDENGKMLEGFPLQGTQSFLLTKFSNTTKPVIIIANGDLLLAKKTM